MLVLVSGLPAQLVTFGVKGGVYGAVALAPRTISGAAHVISYGIVLVTPYRQFDGEASWRDAIGFVAAAGLERRAGILRIAPEVSYGHWNDSPTTLSSGNPHQVDVMLRVGFR
jgi:hypothetical protein